MCNDLMKEGKLVPVEVTIGALPFACVLLSCPHSPAAAFFPAAPQAFQPLDAADPSPAA